MDTTKSIPSGSLSDTFAHFWSSVTGPSLDAVIKPIEDSSEFTYVIHYELNVARLRIRTDPGDQEDIQKSVIEDAIQRCESNQLHLNDQEIFEMTPEQKKVFNTLFPLVVGAISQFTAQGSNKEVMLKANPGDKYRFYVDKSENDIGLFHQTTPFNRNLFITLEVDTLKSAQTEEITVETTVQYDFPSPLFTLETLVPTQLTQTMYPSPLMLQTQAQQPLIPLMEYVNQPYLTTENLQQQWTIQPQVQQQHLEPVTLMGQTTNPFLQQSQIQETVISQPYLQYLSTPDSQMQYQDPQQQLTVYPQVQQQYFEPMVPMGQTTNPFLQQTLVQQPLNQQLVYQDQPYLNTQYPQLQYQQMLYQQPQYQQPQYQQLITQQPMQQYPSDRQSGYFVHYS